MNRVPFTPDGVQLKQDELYSLPEHERIHQAQRIAENSREWLIENFELLPMQIEYVNDISEEFSLFLGWQLASAVIGKQPIILEEPVGPVLATERCKNTEVEVEAKVEHNPQTHQTTYGLVVRIKLGKK